MQDSNDPRSATSSSGTRGTQTKIMQQPYSSTSTAQSLSKKKVIYLIGSLRNPAIPILGNSLRKLGYEVFDDWYAAGPEADDKWRDYEIARGHSYGEALEGFAARHVFEFDKHHLDRADIGVLALPAGRSGHLELGYLVGRGIPSFILFEDIPERYDVMNLFATKVCFNFNQLQEALKEKAPTQGALFGGFND